MNERMILNERKNDKHFNLQQKKSPESRRNRYLASERKKGICKPEFIPSCRN